MIGKIESIDGNLVTVNLSINIENTASIVNLHVVFTSQNESMVGEVLSVSKTQAKILLIGELINGTFLAGVNRKPSFSSVVRIINKNELDLVLSNSKSPNAFSLGRVPLYQNYLLNINPNYLFSNHFCIVGNSGAGKSCSVARMFQNLFANKVPKSNIFIFDVFGEYSKALKGVNNINFKSFTTNREDSDSLLINLPIWLLDVDDLALLLDAESYVQIPIIEKALKIVTIYAMDEEQREKAINDIVASAILDILYSGKSAPQIRDQVIAILSTFGTKTLNLDTSVIVPGWTRTLKQCLILDKDGKLNEIQLVTEFIKRYTGSGIELNMPEGKIYYTLENLADAFDLAFISEGILKSDIIFDKVNILKSRLKTIIESNYGDFFRSDTYITRDDYIRNLNDNGKYNIVNFNVNSITDRQAKAIIKIYSRLLLEYNQKLKDRGTHPVHIFVEEAHRYIQNDRDVELIGYNIFEKIAKEGRKYAVIMGLITQRPSELSNTALSQCANYLIFKMINPADLDYISNIIPNVSEEVMAKIKSLQAGYTLALGTAFKTPVVVKFDLPNPMPYSENVNLDNTWYN